MKRFNNFVSYTPENNLPHVGYLICDEGIDWYECQAQFSDETLKIAFDKTGIICQLDPDISKLFPDKLSVSEVDMNTVPEGVNSDQKWMFDGEKIIPRIYTHDELVEQAERKKTRLLNEAAKIIAPLQDAVDLDMATDDETARLDAWKRYRVLLNRTDTSTAPDIDWPEKPAGA
jgi:hypothetical protein